MRLRIAAVPLLAHLLAGGAALGSERPLKIERPADPASFRDPYDPALRSEPGRALSCPAPCTAGIIQAANAWFKATVLCDDGSFTLAMSATHPASGGTDQPLLFGGVSGDTSGGEVRYHVYGIDVDLPNPGGGGTCLFDPADTPEEPGSIGVEREVSVSPGGGLDLLLREEAVVFGSSDVDAGIRLTLAVTNRSSSSGPAQVGVRWFLDFLFTDDDGPLWAPAVCSPFSVGTELVAEHEISQAEIGPIFQVRNNSGTPEIVLFGSTSALAGHAGTFRPERLLLGRWSNQVGAPWAAVASEGDAIDSDSVLLAYAGYPDTAAITLQPGESATRSIVFLSDCDQQGTGCAAPSGAVGNDLLAVRSGSLASLSWAAATLSPPDARAFRTAAATELAETPAGIGDETVVSTTATRAATDDPGSLTLALYKVLPVDSCGTTIYP